MTSLSLDLPEMEHCAVLEWFGDIFRCPRPVMIEALTMPDPRMRKQVGMDRTNAPKRGWLREPKLPKGTRA